MRKSIINRIDTMRRTAKTCRASSATAAIFGFGTDCVIFSRTAIELDGGAAALERSEKERDKMMDAARMARKIRQVAA